MRAGLKDDAVYSFFDPEIDVLKDMIALITPDHVRMFREAYGGILKMVFRLTDRDQSAIHTFLQFYDPGLRCFVFPDYLLGPLIEDYASILGIQIRNQIPFYVTKEEPDVAKAKEHAVLGDWKNFVDINVIRVFALRNPIPTLVGDVYYSVHNRNEKRRGGLVRCCAQLLYKWFMGYLPPKGAFVFLDHTVKWATKLMGLRAKDIAWTHSGMAGRDFICSCGSFPNVPLIGVQGCINYNPTLLKRQMGFAMEVPPLEREIQESFYFPIEGNQSSLRQVSGAWRNIQRKGKIPFGRANNRSFPPFDDWLRRRVELTRLPFPVENQAKRHALEVKRFEIDTAYYCKISQALESSMKEHDSTKEQLARDLRIIEDEKKRQVLVKTQREARAKALTAEWEAKLRFKGEEEAKIMAERDHYLTERDHYFRQMKIHQKEVGRLQQENTELRFAMKFTRMVDDAKPSVGPSSV
ncbi:hypothetical protein KIW84_013823 [Lathyrus oleraceus]|uniref:DUF7745 domain-containing protein n=1 Tax=Pisum sativum TaxID=3888 RepID=A0A9D5BLH6_PEA|nr:hypothetical protein KIW84_013823 [Pisum sativum]